MVKSDSAAGQSKRHRRNTIKDVKAMELHLLHGKQRFITLLALHDPAGVGSISAEELEHIIQKMKPPISQESLELILMSLPEVEGRRLDYRPLVKGDIVQYAKQYLDSNDNYVQALLKHSKTTEKSIPSIESVQHSSETEYSKAQATMGGNRGALSTAYKEEEQRQFEVLLDFCKEIGILLNKELVEKGTRLRWCF